MIQNKKKKRSNKWAFIIYQESAPKNYLDVLESFHIPFILSPWHDKDVNKETGELLKPHKHGAFFFDSLKSYKQVSELMNPLNAPAHVEIVHSATGLYDYFIHAENPEKAPYNIEDIELGCGFNLDNFLKDIDITPVYQKLIEIIEEHQFIEFQQFVSYIRKYHADLLETVVNKSIFINQYLHSKRYSRKQTTHLPVQDFGECETDK